jgi:hypothetical protein
MSLCRLCAVKYYQAGMVTWSQALDRAEGARAFVGPSDDVVMICPVHDLAGPPEAYPVHVAVALGRA